MFISEPIKPDRATADADAMARGLAGLPDGFTWRDRHYEITEVLDNWKKSEAEGGKANGERYYRKHYYRVRTACGAEMTIYFVRRVKLGESQKQRWWLYSMRPDDGVSANPAPNSK